MSAVFGIVINIHYHGATVRLDDGTLAAVPAAELAANRPTYIASHDARTPLALHLDRRGRHAVVVLERSSSSEPVAPPRLVENAFEAQMNAYLKATEEWAPADRPAPAERHFIRKKRRAAFFEARNTAT